MATISAAVGSATAISLRAASQSTTRNACPTSDLTAVSAVHRLSRGWHDCLTGASRERVRQNYEGRVNVVTKKNITRINCVATEVESLGSREANPRARQVGKGSRLIGSGSAVPSMVITNDALSALVETNDEWIATRTGIRNRRVLSGDESLTKLAIEASLKALEMAKVDSKDVDLLILCTSTPDDIFGGACQVQAALGCKNAVAFDLTAACSGFVMGLITASRFIKGGGYTKVLVIGADALSRYVDWSDRGTCILFGDGAGAVVLRATGEGEEDGLLGFDLRSDGEGHRHLHANVGLSPAPPENGAASTAASNLFRKASPGFIQMNGKEVFRFAVKAVPQVVAGALQEAGLEANAIDWLIMHQANKRILDAVAVKVGIPADRVVTNLTNYGNTSAASIPLALDEAVRSGKVLEGHVVATAGFGAGLTWAGAIIKWG